MRTRSESDLEPLPIIVDGIERAPRSTTRPLRPSAPVAPTWTVPTSLPPTHERRSAGVFRRMIPLEPDRLHSLPSWCEHARSTLVVGPPECIAPDTWTMAARLRVRTRVVPMELTLWSHLREWTLLTLRPKRAVRAGWWYFRRGHRALDRFCEELIGDVAGRQAQTQSEQ